MAVRLTRSAVAVLLMAALAAIVFARTGQAEPASGPYTTVSSSSGSLSITNSGGTGAIVSLSGMAPGRSVTGEVTITNTGTLAGELSLASEQLTETLGNGGGRLSRRVELVVLANGTSEVYRGPFGDLATRALGSIAAGQARRYRFTAALPDGGLPAEATTGDNAYQGAQLSSAFRWTATAPDPPAGPGPGGTPKLSLSVGVAKRQPKVKKRSLAVTARCDRPCTLSASAKMKGARTGLARAKTATPNQRVTLSLKLSKKAAKKLMRAAAKRKGALMTLSVKSSDAAGVSASFTKPMQVRLVRRGAAKKLVVKWGKAKKKPKKRKKGR